MDLQNSSTSLKPSAKKRAAPITQMNNVLVVSFVLVFLNIGLQIAYPLTSASTQRGLTIASVVVFFFASVLHALGSRGLRGALALVIVCVGFGVIAEAIGSKTGWPFGNYRYANTLGFKFVGVPIIVPLAWAMMGWPAFLIGRWAVSSSTGRSRLQAAAAGALILTTWDLFLDPQMVRAGHWSWLRSPGPALNGIPLTNSIGWFVVALAMMLSLSFAINQEGDGSPTLSVFGHRVSADSLMWIALGWTWFSQWFGHLVFFGQPRVALVGGIAMSTVLFGVIKLGLRGRSVLTSQKTRR